MDNNETENKVNIPEALYNLLMALITAMPWMEACIKLFLRVFFGIDLDA